MKFDEYFKNVYGARWDGLLASLRAEAAPKVLLHNPFGGELDDYSLDQASLIPARALAVAGGERIADFCSAPGGKLLAMIFSVAAAELNSITFVANDLSPARVARLKAILYDCLPPAVMARVDVRRGDASRWGQRFANEFDKVLVDAPCSGERHLLASSKELERWTLKGSKRLAIRQNSLLCSALDSVRPGGRVVYSTCSVNPVENDGVVERLGGSREGLFRLVPPAEWLAEDNRAIGEKTEHGWMVMPDISGSGPIYTAVIEKN